jgi:tRNA(Ile2) C34 agmatinyltransferase TiaS
VPMTRRSDALSKSSPSGQTLEDVLAGAWEDLTARSRAECPVCGGLMTAVAEGPGGRCQSCQVELH